jgi:hypothetical protein
MTMKKLMIVATMLFTYGVSNAQWKMNKDEYTNKKSIEVQAFVDGYFRARIRLVSSGTLIGWNIYESAANYLYLSTERVAVTNYMNVYVKINGVNKEFNYPYTNPMVFSDELKEAFKIGSEAAVKFEGDPRYIKFTLNGFSKAINLLTQP